MSSTSKNSKNKKTEYWGETPQLSPQQIVEWLDGYRAFIFEVWTKNPQMIPNEIRKKIRPLSR